MVWIVALLVGCSVLTSCSEQKKRTRKAAVKVETLTVGGSNASGKTKDYVGTIEEKTGRRLVSNWAATSRAYTWTKATE